MAPFPETEIMTLKRLEVALKKSDFGLLREGAYKLHEKFHNGHKFEYIDLLKDILYNARSSSAPNEIKDILIPTIEDILSENGELPYETSSNDNENNVVSPLTSLSYSAEQPYAKESVMQEETDKITAFDAFGTQRAHTSSYYSLNNQTQEENQNEYNEVQNYETIQTIQEDQSLPKSLVVTLFWGTNNTEEKNRNIIQYQEMVSKIDYDQVNFLDVIDKISTINTQTSGNVSEIASVLEQLQNKNVKINLITNSTSASVVGLIESLKIPYKINSPEEKINIIPLFGLSNLFKCTNCSNEHLDVKDEINPYILECPKCKKPMYPNYATPSTNMNLEFYSNFIVNAANSDIWLIFNPNNAEELVLNAMKSAIKLNKSVKNIFIQDKDINAKEIYKKEFNDIDSNIDINVNISVIEDFLKMF